MIRPAVFTIGDEQLADLQLDAKSVGMTTSEYLRTIILNRNKLDIEKNDDVKDDDSENSNALVFETEGMLIPENVCHIRLKTSEFDRFINTVLGGEAVIHRYKGIRYLIFSSDSLPTLYEEALEKTNGKNNPNDTPQKQTTN